MPNKYSLQACFGLLLLSLVPVQAIAQCCLKTRLEVTASDSNQALVLRLTNNEASAVRMKNSALPWGSRYSLVLVAAHEEQPNRQISQQFSIDESTEEIIELEPGKTASRSIELNRYFANLPGELQKGSLILFWSYQLIATDGKTSERQTGSIRLPQRSS